MDRFEEALARQRSFFGTGVTLSVAKASGDELSTYPPLDSGMTLTYSGADLMKLYTCMVS